MAKKRDWRALVAEEETKIQNKKTEDFNSFLKESQDYVQSEAGNYDAVGFSTYGNTYNQFRKSSSDWRDRAQNAKSYLDSISSNLSEDEYKGYLDYINSFDKAIEGFDEGYKSKGNYYSQFASEESMRDFEYANKYKDSSYKDLISIVQRRGNVGEGEYLPEAEFNWIKENYMNFAKKEDYDQMIANSNESEKRAIKTARRQYEANDAKYGTNMADSAEWAIENKYQVKQDELAYERDQLVAEENKAKTAINLAKKVKNRPDFEKLATYVAPKGTQEGKKGYNTRFIDQVNGEAPKVYETMNNGVLGALSYTNNSQAVNEYEYGWKKANEMTEEEKRIYTALYNAEQKGLVEKGSSDEYLNAIDIDARASVENQRKIAEYSKKNPVGATIASVLTSPMKIPSTLMDVANAISGNEVNTNDYYHQIGRSTSTARSAITEEMSDFGSFMYNTGVSMLDTAYNLALGGGGFATSALMAMGAAGNTIVAAKDRGATDGQAVLTGLFAGAAEAFFESVSLGNLKSLSKSGGAGVKNFFLNVLKQSGVEASEETFTEIANKISDYMINGGASEYAKRIESYMAEGLTYKEAASKAAKDGALDIFEAGAGGFVSGGAFGLAGATINAANNYNKGKSVIESGVADQLKTDAESFELDSTVGKRLSELQKKEGKSGKQNASYTGALAQAISEATYADLSTEEKASIETYVKDTLTERGIDADEKTVRAVSKSLFGSSYGNADLTDAERRIVDRVNLTEEIQSELRRMETGEEQQALKLEKRTTSSKLPANVTPPEEDNTARSASVQEKTSKMKVVAEGAGINSLSVKENGDVYITNGEGKTVLATDAELTEEAAEAVAYTEGMSAAKKQAFFEEYSSIDKTLPIDEYHTAFDLAYTYGINGMSVDQAVKYAGPVLSDRKAFEIYKKGATQRGQIHSAIKENTAEIQNVLGENVAPGKVNDKAVRYNQIAPGDPRRAIVSFARVMAHATGRNVTFYQSTAKQQAEGMENGRYDPKTNTLYIDINAGIDEIRGVFNDQVLPTVSHELVHAFRAEDVDGYKALEDLVFAGLKESTGKSKASLVAAERRRIEEADPKRFEGLSAEQKNTIAAEEITARACEDRLANSRMMKDFIADLENKESGLAQKFSNFLGEAIERVKKLFDQIIKKLSGTSEAQSLAKLTDHLEKIQKQFDSLLEARPTQKKENAPEATEMKSDRSTEAVSVEIDEKSESVYPMYSERTWNDSEYVKHRSVAAETISSALGITKRKAYAYIDAINGVAKMIADDRSRLDYEASSFGSAFVSNVEYGGSFDFTTLCPKRRLYTGTFQEIQKQMPNDALTADEILQIRNLMLERGLESTCGLCYVEGSRAEMGKFSKEFIKLYKKYNPNAEWYPNMVDVNTPDGVEKMRINHPEVYTEYEYFWNHYGKLKETDPALFASQQKPKLYEARKEYKNEILNQFSVDKTVEAKNRNGGIRIQSFSDFEMVHMIDMMQIIMDMSRVKLAGQAYTKIPAFADAFGSTGLKINLSLIAKGVDANGKLIFDDREGMAHEIAFSLREKYSKNVGTILVIFNDEQLTAAMADPRVDFIIPFHRSQWKKRQYGAMGLPKNTKDYTYQQNEKLIKQTYHEWRGKMVKDKAKNFMPNEYWDFTKSGKQNAENYLKLCAESNKRPKFYKLLENNGDGTYSLKEDGSTDGYWKLLIDFKMYDNKGKGAPQNPVTPDFSMSEISGSIEAYEGGHQSYPVAYDVVDEFMGSRNRVMKADRATYESARELLLQAAEEAEKTTSKNKSKLLAEYKSRVAALDRKYNRLEAAEQEYTASLDSSNKELSEKLYEKVSRLQKEINQTERDLRLIEESKEMVKEYQKQWGEWLNATRQGVVMQKPTRPIDPKYDLAGIVRREKALTKNQTEKEVKVNAAKKLFDYKESVERKNTLERIDAKIRVFAKKLAKNTRKEHIPDDLKRSIENLIKAVRVGENLKEETDVPIFKEGTKVPEAKQRKWAIETKYALRELKAAVKQNAQYDVASDKKSSENEKGDDVQYSELLMIDENILQEMDAIATYLEKMIDANEGYFLLSEMDLENLKGLDRVIGSVSRAISNVDKALASQGKQTISQLAEEDMKEMLTFAKDNAKRSTLRTLLTWSQMTPYTAFSLFGKGGKQIYMNLLKGWGDYARYAKSVIDFADESWTEKQVKKWSGTVNKYTLNGQEFEATPAQIMYLYCLNKRDQGLLHLNRDGFQVGAIRINGKTTEAKSLSKNAIKSTRQQRTEFFNEHLPVGSDERRVADKIQRFLSTTCAEWGNELSYKMYGYRAFTDPYYVPIIVDPTKLSASAGDFETGLYSMFNKGFMKPLNEKAEKGVQAVDLFDIFATHAADMAKYRALGLPVLDAIHYMNYTKVEQLEDGTVVKNPDNMKTVMQATYGPAAFEYLKRFLKDLNESARIDTDATESAYASMVKSYKTAAVGFNVKVAALQPTSYYRAFSVLSAKSMTKAAALLVKEKAENAFDREKVLKYSELAQEYSGMALWKSLGYYDVGIGRSLSSQIKHDEAWKDKTIEIAMKGAEYGDKWTLGVLFKACCLEVQQNGSAKTQKEIYKAAGELLDEVIVRTQVVDSTMTRSQAMRNKSQLLKMLTSFMSEPTVGYNLLLQEYYKAANDLKKGVKPKDVFLKHKRSLGKTFAAYTVTALAAAAVETFFAAIRDDDDEELAEIAKTFGLKFYENMNPITKVPVVADLWEYIESLLLNKKMYSDDMAYASIDEAVTLVQSIIKITKEGMTANGMYDVIEGASNTASYATGIPIGNALRTVKRAWNNTIGELTGQKFGVKEPSTTEQIEKAFEENQMAPAVETLVAEKLAELKEERPNADPDDLEKRAISSVKASVSRQFKEMYLEAYESKDRSTMRKIELALEDSGLYEDVSETLENWIEAYEKDKEEKGISSKKK